MNNHNKTKHLEYFAMSAQRRHSAFFEKQIPRPGASTHMQIGAAWVFSITCCDLHSWFVWAHHISSSGQEGQGRLNALDILMIL